MNKKNIIITILLSLCLFLFIVFLGYIIYIYGIYDKKNKDNYLNEFNNGNFSFVYNNLVIDKEDQFINEAKFNNVVGLMYNKNIVKDIYYSYYEDSYESIDDFFDNYFFGYNKIKLDNIEFEVTGETDLFNRASVKYKYIDVKNNDGSKSKLGVFKDIKFNVSGNGKLIVDDIEVSCADNVCTIPYMFGGLHTVFYKDSKKEYFSLLNIGRDLEFNIKDDIFIEIEEDEEKEVEMNKNSVSYDLVKGRYLFKECYLESGCPSRGHSYLDLNEDGTARMYTYIMLDIAGETYEGTYKIKNNFLYITFNSHIYNVHDYDTKERTDILGNLDIDMDFKIISDTEFSNYNYSFVKQ